MNKLTSEVSIDPESFKAIAQLAYSESGLILAVEKTSMIQSRLRHRLKALSLSSFSQYSSYVCSDSGSDERRHMISALTTNVSHFFRENHHFEILEEQLRLRLLPKLKAGGKVRIWSAGCSNGQEAMSIAMTLLETEPDIGKLNIKVLATDIDAQVVNFAADACYPERLTSGIPNALSKKYFTLRENGGERFFSANNSLRELVSYRELNLLNDWPMRQQMDVIFCRNVVIYFDQKTQNRLWPRFRQLLASDGFLFLGHSERIPEPQESGFQTDGPTTYKPIS